MSTLARAKKEAWAVHATEPAEPIETRLQKLAMACVTPAQMARVFGLPRGHVEELLNQLGIQVSRGAARGSTYTKRDLEVFDAAARQRLYELILAEVGTDELARAAYGADWYDTVVGKAADTVLQLFGGGAEHVSSKRRPIRKRDFVLAIVGLPLSIFFLPLLVVWWYSWEAWRAGKTDWPKGAVGVGWIMMLVPFAGAVSIVIHLVGLLFG